MAVVPLPRMRLPRAGLVQLATAPTVQEQRILSVEFRSHDGRSWTAIGGGDTVAEAIEWAWESCPSGTTWQPVGWRDLHGD